MTTRKLRVYGIVQGVGFRPTVDRHATKTGVKGTVCNYGPYVEIIVQGTEAQVNQFQFLLETEPPKRAAILKIDVKEWETTEENGSVPVYDSFSIIESGKTSGEIFISPDIAICDECKAELQDPKNRRHLHPFINCTCCGPRMTILDALPYDRERTSMKEFPMCPDCDQEYHNPSTRRYDAQPVCCNHCGPEVYLLDRDVRGREAITQTRQIIKNGGVVAIKGIGGFHLCCDATNSTAVQLLRNRKNRPAKPFAVMMRNAKIVEQECDVSQVQEDILKGHQKPIILLKRKADSHLCEAVAPDNPKVGVMLPYAPIHLLLFDYDDGIEMSDCLVMTSANVSGAPICRDDEDARKELGHLCDGILSHNRKIRIRADDSVMDFYNDEPYMIRRSRGYAPLPFLLGTYWKGNVLAMGGELKNTFCIGVNNLFYPSPYVGDLADLRTVKALQETETRFQRLLEAEPTVVACDLHPKYNSTTLAKETGLPVIPVQHHYAHILSCMAENDYKESVIGVSFDGTGYGTDGTVWGGEFLLCNYDGFERKGSIKPFLQIGGDRSAKEGWRIAVSMLYGLALREAESISAARSMALEQITKLNLCDEKTANVQFALYDQKINAINSTSAGRLFDAVSALLGVRLASTFEGEASTTLMYRAQAFKETHPEYEVTACPDLFKKERNGGVVLATDALVKFLLEKKLAEDGTANSDGVGNSALTGELSYLFHALLARQIVAACKELREETKENVVALSGGVFQNTLLLDEVKQGLEAEHFQVLKHTLVPPNDGGIALGQAVYAMNQINKEG